MNRVRAAFIEPIWGFLFALLPWVLMLPVFFLEYAEFELKIVAFDIDFTVTKWMNYVFCAVYLSLQGVVINRIINRLNLFVKENYLAALFISVFGSMVLLKEGFDVSCLAAWLYSVGVFWLCKAPKEGRLNRYVFNSGFFIFLAVLLDLKFLSIAPLCLILILFLRTFSFRDVFVFLSAPIVILVIVQQFQFLLHGETLKMNDLILAAAERTEGLSHQQMTATLALLGIQLMLLLGSVPKLHAFLNNKFKAISRIFICGFLLLCGLVLVDLMSFGRYNSLIYMIPAISLFITANYMFIRNKWILRVHFLSVGLFLFFFFYHIPVEF